MRKWPRRLLYAVMALLAVGLPGYYMLVRYSPTPATDFPLDIAAVRALGDFIQGEKAGEVRYESVLTLKFAEAMQLAGDPWRTVAMTVFSYQLIFPDRTLIIDTAMARADAKPDFLVMNFDEAAYGRMQAAMDKASQIVITHEHMDHIGGIAAHPHLARILPALRLTAEQVANPKGMEPVKLPTDVMSGYQPLRYDRMIPIAPGVVLIKSPGHTPGSQMVYVKRADGRELLFLGDVSWRLRNIELVRERPLFMTLMIGENRQQVLGEFQALHALHQREPGIALVPGHEGPVVEALASSGVLRAGFR